MLRSRVSKGVDTGRLGKALSRPGMDPRVHVQTAFVTAVHLDPEHGYFVDITLMPSGVEETARVAPVYAGSGFGIFLPVQIDDEVVVVTPHGDPNAGLLVIARPWDNGTPPPADAANHPDDLLILAKDSANIRIVTGGSGNVIIEPRGAGQVQLGQEDAPHPSCRGDLLQARLNTLIDAYNSHFHSTGTENGPTTPPIFEQLPNPGPPPAFLPAIPALSVSTSPSSDLSPNVRVK